MNPRGLTFDRTGGVLVADGNGGRIFRFDPSTGATTLVAGRISSVCVEGDGVSPIGACLDGPADVAVDATGSIFIATTYGRRAFRLDPHTGLLWRYAGTGATNETASGEGGPALQASIGGLQGVAVGADGDVFFASGQGLVWRVDHATGIILRAAGEIPGECRGEAPASWPATRAYRRLMSWWTRRGTSSCPTSPGRCGASTSGAG